MPSAHAGEQRVGELDVEHRGLVDHDDVLVQRPVLAAGEAAVEGDVVAGLARLRAEQPVQGRGGGVAQLLEPLGRAAGRGGQRDACARRASASATSAATVRLLPVPGPPVSTVTPPASAAVTAESCTASSAPAVAACGLDVDRFGGGEQPRDALRDAVLGLGVAGQPEHPVVGLDHRRRDSTAASIAACGSPAPNARQRAGDVVAGVDGVPVAGLPGQHPADQRAGPARVVAA